MSKPWQHQFDFEGRSSGGLEKWHLEQQQQREELARSMGLPLGHSVEVWLKGGVRLRGRLRLAEALLLSASATHTNTRFAVGSVTFAYDEVESCTRTDESASASESIEG